MERHDTTFTCGLYIVGVTNVGGDAVESVPSGDAIFLKVPLSFRTLKTIFDSNIIKKNYHISLVIFFLVKKMF